jgi:mitochondrial fission protein ELM1
MVKVIALQDGVHLGDDDNALAIAFGCAKGAPVEQINIHNPQRLAEFLIPYDKEDIILIGAGVQSLPLLQAVGSQQELPQVKTVWSGHQHPVQLDQRAIGILDNIVLPDYEIGHALKLLAQEKVISSGNSVPTTKTTDHIITAYESAVTQGTLPQAQHYIAVVLGGDAVEKDGTVKSYSAEEAFAMGQMVGQQAVEHDYTVLATNGPRTGAYSDGVRHEDAHQAGAPLDSVSQAFLAGLQAAGLPEQQQAFYNFTYGEQSALDSLLGAVASHTGSHILIPADSTTMLSEAVQTLPTGRLLAYDTSAMNDAHRQQVEQLVTEGRAYRLDSERKNLIAPSQLADTPPIPNHEMVAQAVLASLENPQRITTQPVKVLVSTR